MTLEEAVARVVEMLQETGLQYMVVGSFASNYHGVPRMTHDADLVIEARGSAVLELVVRLSGEFYVSEEAAREALRLRKQFNAIHLESGFKVDLIVKKRRPFSDEELGRKQPGTLAGKQVEFATAEDTILTKLEWAMIGDSERQYDDAVNVLRVQGDDVDWDYVERWADNLGIRELVERARRGDSFRK